MEQNNVKAHPVHGCILDESMHLALDLEDFKQPLRAAEQLLIACVLAYSCGKTLVDGDALYGLSQYLTEQYAEFERLADGLLSALKKAQAQLDALTA